MSEQRNIEEKILENFSVDHSSAIPLHKQVEDLLREIIKHPSYAKGALLPKEVDMSKRLGISRNTIRQATNKLVHENLLIRKKGVGTTVARQTLTSKLDNWFSFSQEMHEKGLEFVNYSLRTGSVKATADVAQHLQIEKGKRVIRLERLRGLKDGPFVYFISYFHPRIGFTGKEDFTRHLYEIMEQDYATIPSLSKEEIKAMLADEFLAEQLGIKVGDPILFRKRIVCDPGERPIEYNLGYYRADRFSYAIDIYR
ncbi:MAG: GntR family transcriptional regulator [Saprospiraceae bacterium]|nr:GntR family transcriptional regulator [Saprospiraceae bacterium]